MEFAWRKESPHTVQSENELASLLDEADRAEDELPIAVLTAESGSEISIGLGHPSRSVLVYFPAGYDGVGSMHSVGNAEERGRDEWQPPLTFFFFTHHSEFPKWMGIPKADAREAVHEFFRTDGSLPSGIRWEQD